MDSYVYLIAFLSEWRLFAVTNRLSLPPCSVSIMHSRIPYSIDLLRWVISLPMFFRSLCEIELTSTSIFSHAFPGIIILRRQRIHLNVYSLCQLIVSQEQQIKVPTIKKAAFTADTFGLFITSLLFPSLRFVNNDGSMTSENSLQSEPEIVTLGIRIQLGSISRSNRLKDITRFNRIEIILVTHRLTNGARSMETRETVRIPAG